MLEKKLNSYLTLRREGFQFFSRCLSVKEFSQAFVVAEIVISPSDSFSNSSSLLDIRLAIGILNKFFWFKLLIEFVSPEENAFKKVAKDSIKNKKKKGE
jgi:hypothetical protein